MGLVLKGGHVGGLLRELQGTSTGYPSVGPGFIPAALLNVVDAAFYEETKHAASGWLRHVFFLVSWDS